MHKSITAIALMTASALVFAQASIQAQHGSVQANVGGVNIQGNTDMNVNASNVNAVAVGKDNKAKNTVGSIKGGTNIKGNTRMNVNARNVNAVAVGKGNTAENSVGAIGGN